jgi:hypothetical protein
LISRATWPEEQVRIATIQNIQQEGAGLLSPTILVMGRVIDFRKG